MAPAGWIGPPTWAFSSRGSCSFLSPKSPSNIAEFHKDFTPIYTGPSHFVSLLGSCWSVKAEQTPQGETDCPWAQDSSWPLMFLDTVSLPGRGWTRMACCSERHFQVQVLTQLQSKSGRLPTALYLGQASLPHLPGICCSPNNKVCQSATPGKQTWSRRAVRIGKAGQT